jgi:hypothetical protein
MNNKLLDSIATPADVRRLSRPELKQLAAELREFVVQSVSQTGGHLSSNLGTVELTIGRRPPDLCAQGADRPPRGHGDAAPARRHLGLSAPRRE